MAKYGAEATEKAYELYMIQQLPMKDVVRKMKEDYPVFGMSTLSKWREDKTLDWTGRYDKHRKELAAKSDKALVKQITPIATAIQEIREQTYQQIIAILNSGKSPINEKNFGMVLQAFVKLADLETRKTGGGKETPVKDVISVIFMVLEKSPAFGPVFQAHKNEIVDAIYEEIETK